MSPDTHYFVGVPVAEHVAALIGTWVNEKKAEYGFKKWLVPEDYHITLSFLGKASEVQIEMLQQQLPKMVQEVPIFSAYDYPFWPVWGTSIATDSLDGDEGSASSVITSKKGG